MAVGGRILRETLRLGCDECSELPCSPCAKDGKNTDAVKYCVECDENLCATCLTYHNRFASMRGHQISDNLKTSTGEMPNLPTQRCDIHGGKLVELYCPTDDSVGCAACMAVDHSACDGKRYIPEIIEGMVFEEELASIEKEIQKSISRLCCLKKIIQRNVQHIQQEKHRLLKDLKELRQWINDKLDEMETHLAKEVELAIETKMREVNQDVRIIDDVNYCLDKTQRNISNARKVSKAESFVQLKMGNTSLLGHGITLQNLSTNVDPRPLKLVWNTELQKELERGDAKLGYLVETCVPKSIIRQSSVSGRLPDDKTCSFVDICFTSAGNIFLTDFRNKRVKKLDAANQFKVLKHIDMPDHPYGVCEIDSKQLAVTLQNDKKIHFVSQESLTLGNSFSVRDRCRGIDCYNGRLYVCCGGSREEEDEGTGHIEVFDVDGKLLRMIFEGLSCPIYIKHLETGTILVTDMYTKAIIAVNERNQSVSEMEFTKLSGTLGLSKISDGKLCIAGYHSNNVVLVGEDGNEQQELLKKEDGIRKPVSVCFDSKRCLLLVLQEDSDSIKIFKMVF